MDTQSAQHVACNSLPSQKLPLLGRLPLDPELARRCDAGEIEAYAAEQFEPIAEEVARRLSMLETVAAASA